LIGVFEFTNFIPHSLVEILLSFVWFIVTAQLVLDSTQNMATLATALTASKAFATPLERGGIQIPARSDPLQQGNDLLRCFWVLTCQSAPDEYPLYFY
jgi:hypothetical protein